MNTQNLIHSIIQRIATGPELSKNIETEEAEVAMSAILSGEIDEVQAAIFLIALRMKRETMEENIGILEALLKFTDCQKIDVDNLVDIGDPYSGYNRSIPISAFFATTACRTRTTNANSWPRLCFSKIRIDSSTH